VAKAQQERLFPLERPTGSITWELRAKWGRRQPVVLTLSERCNPRRLEGLVSRVAPSGAFVVCDGWHVPTEEILAVHLPHYTQEGSKALDG
jgi:hypothetical protein